MGGRGASSSNKGLGRGESSSNKGANVPTHTIPKDKKGKPYTVSSWIKENGSSYKYTDFVVANKDRTIILDDRIAYLKSRGKDYMNSFRAETKGRTVYDIEYKYPGGKEVVTLILDDKKKGGN